MINIIITTQEINEEVNRLQPPTAPRYCSTQATEDLAIALIRNRKIAEHEAAERERIAALSDADLEAELAGCEAQLPEINGRVAEADAKLNKLRDKGTRDLREPEGDVFSLKAT